MAKKLTPGRLAAHVQFRRSVLKRLEAEDRDLIRLLLAQVPEQLRPLFQADPYLLETLVETGSCVRQYKEPRGEARNLFPSIKVLRSRLRKLRAAWAGLVRIRIRQTDHTHTRVRFTVIDVPKV